jgi:hypothetical protein
VPQLFVQFEVIKMPMIETFAITMTSIALKAAVKRGDYQLSDHLADDLEGAVFQTVAVGIVELSGKIIEVLVNPKEYSGNPQDYLNYKDVDICDMYDDSEGRHPNSKIYTDGW